MLVVSAQDSNYFAYHSTCCSGVITHSVYIVEEYASFVGYSNVDFKKNNNNKESKMRLL